MAEVKSSFTQIIHRWNIFEWDQMQRGLKTNSKRGKEKKRKKKMEKESKKRPGELFIRRVPGEILK